jgi:UDP-2,3-diacylglucosamine pyrophosphatase LpxH
MPSNSGKETNQLHDLIVFSDLHLGEGRNNRTRRYSPMEDFFYDEAFARLLMTLMKQYEEDPSRLVLVLNGDVFDFLTISTIPDQKQLDNMGISVSATERRFGLDPTPKKSVFKLDMIISGHKPFFEALASFVSAGHKIEILRGNHDLELFFERVQQHIRQRLTEFAGGPSQNQVHNQIRFHQWFYLEPERIYIEHGNQYEPSNSIRYPLSPILSGKSPDGEILLDYPLGSLFVRYFYNHVHRLNPYAPRVISFEQYLTFLRHYNLFDMFRLAKVHYPFLVSAMRHKSLRGSSGSSSKANAKQDAEFKLLEESTEPKDLYEKLNRIKVHPMTASKLAMAKEMLGPVVRRSIFVAAVSIGILYVWMVLLNVVQAPMLGESILLRALLLFIFSLATLAGLLWVLNKLIHKLRRSVDITVSTCVKSAGRITQMTGVRMVLMGHTHEVDIREVAQGKAIYANSGTWISVHNPWSNLVPEARRLTFLYVKDDQVQICRWNDDANRVDEVPMFTVSGEQVLEPIHAGLSIPPSGRSSSTHRN